MATDGWDGAFGDAGDLSVGQSLEVAQDDRYALRRRQGRDGGCDGRGGQIPFGLPGGLVVGGRDIAEQVERLGGQCPGDPVQRLAGDNLVEPGGEAGIRLEPG